MSKRVLVTFTENESKLLMQLCDKMGEPMSVIVKNITINHLLTMELKLK